MVWVARREGSISFIFREQLPVRLVLVVFIQPAKVWCLRKDAAPKMDAILDRVAVTMAVKAPDTKVT